MKKLTLMAALLVLAASIVTAQEPVAPKIGLEFSQRMDADFIDGALTDAQISDYDTVYSRTEIKAKAAFKFDALSVTPWAKDRFEGRFNPGDLEAVDADVEKLGKIRFRNRFYFGIDSAYTISEALIIGLNLEFRAASDLRTDKDYTPANDEAALPEYRFAPALVVSGTISGFYYSVTQGIPLYFDTSIGDWDNDQDNFYWELEGTYNVGYKMEAGELPVTFDLLDELTVTMPENEVAEDTVSASRNTLNAKIMLGLGDFIPAVGFLWVMTTGPDTDDIEKSDIKDQIFGGTIGATFKKENWSLGFTYGLGVNTNDELDENQTESFITTTLKIKI